MPTQSRSKPSQSTPSILYPQTTSSKASTRLGCSMYLFFSTYRVTKRESSPGTCHLLHLPSPALMKAELDPAAGPQSMPHGKGGPMLPRRELVVPLDVWSSPGKETSSACPPVPSPGWGARHHLPLHLVPLCFQEGKTFEGHPSSWVRNREDPLTTREGSLPCLLF